MTRNASSPNAQSAYEKGRRLGAEINDKLAEMQSRLSGDDWEDFLCDGMGDLITELVVEVQSTIPASDWGVFVVGLNATIRIPY